MRPTYTRRRTRRPTSRDMATFKKDSQQEPLFFGGATHEAFFKPVTAMPQVQVQRKCANCEGEEKLQRSADKEDEKVQKKEAVPTVSATNATTNYVSHISGKGQPMSKNEQSFFGSRMGSNFSNVKIHTSTEAAASAQAVNAQAYTYGNHIVFGHNQYRPATSSGQHLLAHELTHVAQQNGTTVNGKLQRQVVPPAPIAPVPGAVPVAPAAPVPHFRDCVRSVTGRDDADAVLNAAMNRAIDFVNTAIGLLQNAPAAGTVYEEALATHFGTPLNDRARLRLRTVFQRILGNLTVANFICNRRACPAGHTQAMWDPSDDLLHICLPFWGQDATCQAVVIIHEAAHDAGIDLDDPAQPVEVPHSPNRGQPSYPVVGEPRRGRVSRSRRANTPDAYAFFAAHVQNGADTPGDCFN